MIPPIFQYAQADDTVRTLIGGNPTRFWPFDAAPQPGHPGYCLPYSTWQFAYGSPDNYLGQLPDSDNAGIQIDAWAQTPSGARSVMTALRDALEPYGMVVAYNGEDKDPQTGLYRASFTIEFWTDR